MPVENSIPTRVIVALAREDVARYGVNVALVRVNVAHGRVNVALWGVIVALVKIFDAPDREIVAF